MGLGDALANWKCVCGRGMSIEHPFGGHCSGRLVIEDLQQKLERAESKNLSLRAALENIQHSLRLSWFTKENAQAIAKEALAYTQPKTERRKAFCHCPTPEYHYSHAECLKPEGRKGL